MDAPPPSLQLQEKACGEAYTRSPGDHEADVAREPRPSTCDRLHLRLTLNSILFTPRATTRRSPLSKPQVYNHLARHGLSYRGTQPAA
jgi:hypothetical protein